MRVRCVHMSRSRRTSNRHVRPSRVRVNAAGRRAPGGGVRAGAAASFAADHALPARRARGQRGAGGVRCHRAQGRRIHDEARPCAGLTSDRRRTSSSPRLFSPTLLAPLSLHIRQHPDGGPDQGPRSSLHGCARRRRAAHAGAGGHHGFHAAATHSVIALFQRGDGRDGLRCGDAALLHGRCPGPAHHPGAFRTLTRPHFRTRVSASRLPSRLTSCPPVRGVDLQLRLVRPGLCKRHV